MVRISSFARAVGLSGALLACGSPAPGEDGGRDGGGTSLDGGDDASLVDASGVDLGPSGCYVDARETVFEDLSGGAIPFALAAGNADFLFVTFGVGGEGEPTVITRLYDAEGALGPVVAASEGVAGDVLGVPAALRTDAGWLVGWTRERGGVPTLRGQRRLPSGELDELSSNGARDLAPTGSTGAAFAAISDRVSMAYVDTAEAPAVLRHAVLDADGAEVTAPALAYGGVEPVSRVESHATDAGAMLVFSDASGEIRARRVSASGEAVGSPFVVPEPGASPDGAFAAAFSGVAVGVVYGHSPAGVRSGRIRRITPGGDLSAQVGLLSTPDAEPTAFSMARFSAAFALLYRSASPGRNRLRIAIASSGVDVVFDTALWSLLDGEGEVAVRQARDGSLRIAWVDRNVEGVSRVLTSRLTCRP